jgi:hypothetical protein
LPTVICTPKFPSYPSGHAVISGCSQVILSYFFPPEAGRLKELADECAISRIWGGVHYPVDGEQGLRLGRQIGKIIVSVLKSQHDEDLAMIDPQITENLNANLPPPPYKQTIPFPRPKVCDSLMVNECFCYTLEEDNTEEYEEDE